MVSPLKNTHARPLKQDGAGCRIWAGFRHGSTSV